MEYNKNLVWTPAPTYAFSIDKAVILTTLKQGTTYLSENIYSNIRTRYNFDLVNQDVIDFGETDGGDWKLEDDTKDRQEYLNKIKKSALIDLNLILMGDNVKKTIIIIRNPIKRIISSILEDTIRLPLFLTDGEMGNLQKLYEAYLVPTPDIKFKNNIWWFQSSVTDLQKSIYYEYLFSRWIGMLNHHSGPGAFHYINQWESFVYALINQEKFNKNKCEIYDLDDINLNDLIQKNIVKLPISENKEKIHALPNEVKDEMLQHLRNSSKYRQIIGELTIVDNWFYQILKNKKSNLMEI